MTALQESVNQWPEDEARATWSCYLADIADGFTEEDAKASMQRERQHMVRVLSKEDAAFAERYTAKLDNYIFRN